MRLGTTTFRHHDRIMSLVVSPRASIAASMSWRSLDTAEPLRLWDLRTGKEIARLAGFPITPRHAEFSPNGKTLGTVLVRWDGLEEPTVDFWDIPSGEKSYSVPGARHFSFSSDGQHVATAMTDGSIQIRAAEGGERRRVIRAHAMAGDQGRGCIEVVFSPDGERVASAGADGTVALWETRTQRELRRWRSSTASPPCRLLFSPTGQALICLDGLTLSRLDALPGDKRVLAKLQAVPSGTFFPPDGKGLVRSDGSRVVMLDIDSGREVFDVRGALLSTTADKKCIAVLTGREVIVYDLCKKKELHRARLDQPFPRDALYLPSTGGLSADGQTLVVACGNALRILDTVTGKDRFTDPGHWTEINFVGFYEKGRRLASVADTTVRCWEMGSGTQVGYIKAGDCLISSATQPLGAKWVGTGATDGVIQVWDLVEGKEKSRFQTEMRSPQVAMTSLGNVIAAKDLAEQSKLFVTEMLSPKERRFLGGKQQTDSTYAVAFLPSSKTLAELTCSPGASPELRVSLVNTTEGKKCDRCAGVQTGGYGRVPFVCSQDGRFASASCLDPKQPRFDEARAVAVWDLVSGKTVARLGGHGGPVRGIGFSPKGRLLASGASDGMVRLWDLASGRELVRIPGHRGSVTSISFSADAELLAAGGSDGTILVWNVSKWTLPRDSSSDPLRSEDLEKLWASLMDDDATIAHKAVWRLVAGRNQSSAFLKDQWRKTVPSDRLLNELVEQLGASRYFVRENAARELRAFGSPAVPVLRKAARESRSAEVRLRAEKLLTRLGAPEEQLPPQLIRAMRVIQILEYIGTVESRQLLQAIAMQEGASQVGREAKGALERMDPEA
jgi:WD40 repeat protein